MISRSFESLDAEIARLQQILVDLDPYLQPDENGHYDLGRLHSYGPQDGMTYNEYRAADKRYTLAYYATLRLPGLIAQRDALRQEASLMSDTTSISCKPIDEDDFLILPLRPDEWQYLYEQLLVPEIQFRARNGVSDELDEFFAKVQGLARLRWAQARGHR